MDLKDSVHVVIVNTSIQLKFLLYFLSKSTLFQKLNSDQIIMYTFICAITSIVWRTQVIKDCGFINRK